MTRALIVLAIGLGFVAGHTSPSVEAQGQKPSLKALVGGVLIDGGGGEPLRDSVVLIGGDRIEAVGTVETLPVPSQYQRISTEGMTVLPGLWEFHTHLQYIGHPDYARWRRENGKRYESVVMPAAAEQLLLAGVTSARDMGAPPDAVLAVKARIDRGELPGPTLYVAGPQLTAVSSPETQDYRWGVANPAEAAERVRQLADKGVHLIKVTDLERMDLETARAIVNTAHSRGLKVAAHGRAVEEIRRGILAGVDEFEHVDPRTEYPDELLAAIRERAGKGKLYWVPTAGTLLHAEYLRENPEMLDDPSWQHGLPPDMLEDAKKALSSFFRRPVAASGPRAPLNVATLKRKLDQLRESGVELMTGADIGTAGEFHSEGTWLELDAWVNRLGIDPMEAIRRSTYWPAVVMGVDRDYGTVSKGKYADIIAVRGDPLRHVHVFRSPALVIKHGRRAR
jgi:imidazolonepropionase-like amidohydrolase